LAIAVAPVLWLAYNAAVYGDALAFANSPYSAQGIEQRVHAPNPAFQQCRCGGDLFLEIGANSTSRKGTGALLAGSGHSGVGHRSVEIGARSRLRGCCCSCGFRCCSMPCRLPTARCSFMSPRGGRLPYSTSVTDSSCLPMFAVSAGMLTASVFLLSARGRHSGKLTALMFALVVASYASVWRAGPHACRKHRGSGRHASPLNSQYSKIVARLPRPQVSHDISEHVGIMEQAGTAASGVNSEDHAHGNGHPILMASGSTRWPDPPRYVDFG